MSHSLGDLLAGQDAEIRGDAAIPIRDLCYDSRRLEPGDLFVALRGQNTDGHRYLDAAAEAGAAALLVEEFPSEVSGGVPVARIADTRRALAEVAACFFGSPAAGMTLIGVTGTNGKTSTVRIIESILRQARHRVGAIDTVSFRFGDEEEPSTLTTPESLDLQRTLARMRAAGVDRVVLEVSSHSIVLERIRTLRFACGVFTQLSQDHLDFHTDMQDYGRAKGALFAPPYLAGSAVLNADDGWSQSYAESARRAGCPVLWFGRGSPSAASEGSELNLHTVGERVGLDASYFVVESEGRQHELSLPLPGDFQIDNALAAVAAALALGIPWDLISKGLAATPPVPGRLEAVSREPVVLVDYAHTPDALDRVLSRVRPLVRGRLITVFGCGGDRDRSKRAPMAAAACRHSDYVIATSDNPRTERAERILDDLRAGLAGDYEVIVDRREGIRRAIAIATNEDTVVIAGKGHENYQILGQERVPFDDREEARHGLALRHDRREQTP